VERSGLNPSDVLATLFDVERKGLVRPFCRGNNSEKSCWSTEFISQRRLNGAALDVVTIFEVAESNAFTGIAKRWLKHCGHFAHLPVS
jgi:hypothetical protein